MAETKEYLNDLLELQRGELVRLKEKLEHQREAFVRYLRPQFLTWREADEAVDKILND